jgi:hypothetical protein
MNAELGVPEEKAKGFYFPKVARFRGFPLFVLQLLFIVRIERFQNCHMHGWCSGACFGILSLDSDI